MPLTAYWKIRNVLFGPKFKWYFGDVSTSNLWIYILKVRTKSEYSISDFTINHVYDKNKVISQIIYNVWILEILPHWYDHNWDFYKIYREIIQFDLYNNLDKNHLDNYYTLSKLNNTEYLKSRLNRSKKNQYLKIWKKIYFEISDFNREPVVIFALTLSLFSNSTMSHLNWTRVYFVIYDFITYDINKYANNVVKAEKTKASLHSVNLTRLETSFSSTFHIRHYCADTIFIRKYDLCHIIL